jgi:hypothetical protein
VHKEQFENENSIDPEILGYIFERAMTARDRKGTGAYYTPKPITRYISENTIYPHIIDRTNEFLKTEKGYKDTELIKDIDELFILPATTLKEIWDKTILKLRVLDNACGSGAFLLAAANILFELNRRINDKLGLRNSDTALKKLILINNLYGVDINPNGIEIAKLRLWLWLVDSYEPERIEPLPNIDYNLRVGNSLIGYVDLGEFKETKLTLSDWLWDEEKTTLDEFLNERNDLILEYKRAEGEAAKELKGTIQEFDEKINNLLNADLYTKFRENKIKISKEEFLELKPFHWGFEFYEVFDLNRPKEERGFDVVVGNPPYVRNTDLPEREKKHYSQKYESAHKQYDIFVLFFEIGIKLLQNKGLFGFISSNKFLVSDYGQKLRDVILKNCRIVSLVDTSYLKIFKDASTYPVITILQKESTEINRTGNEIIFQKISEIEDLHYKQNVIKVKQSKFLASTDNRFFEEVGGIKFRLVKKIEKGNIKLKDLFMCRRGSPKNKITILNEMFKNSMGCIVSRDVGRYFYNISNDTFIISNLQSRVLLKDKILLPRTVLSLKSAYDRGGNFIMDRIYYLIPKKGENVDLKFVTLVLNSKVIGFYYKVNFGTTHVGGGYLDLRGTQIVELPIKITTNQTPFIHLCDYMLFLNETEELRKSEKELIEFIDKQIIDSLVYELYFGEKFKEDGLKPNLLGLVEPYLEDIEGLKSGEEKLRVVKEVVEGIENNRAIKEQIEQIKGHAWVKEIEEEGK